MNNQAGFRMRLRVRLGIPIGSSDKTAVIEFDGKSVTIKEEKGDPLNASRWIVFGATEFSEEAAAKNFGERLSSMLEIVGMCTHLGVDVGQNRPTLYVNESWARSIGFIEESQRLATNIHGLMVLPNDGNTVIPYGEGGQLSTQANFANVFGAMTELRDLDTFPTPVLMAGVRVLNKAIISQEALSRTVLALSAVEALGQSERWTKRQENMLSQLANNMEEGGQDDAEALEVAHALRRSTHRFGLRQGVMRVLSQLNIEHLRREWDRLYAQRSGVFHGTAHLSEDQLNQLASSAIQLSGTIIIAALERERVRVPSIAKVHFPEATGQA